VSVGVLRAGRTLHRPFVLLHHHHDYHIYVQGLMLAEIGLGKLNPWFVMWAIYETLRFDLGVNICGHCEQHQ
jgi:hypothetical protein